MLLIKFILNDVTYLIYGRYKWEQEKNSTCPYPAVIHLTACTSTGSERSVYKPKGQTFSGIRYKEKDMFYSVLSAMMSGDPKVKVTYLQEELQVYIDAIVNHCVLLDGKKYPDVIRYGLGFELYERNLVTDKYAYYLDGDRLLMLNDGAVVSDNYFAEDGFNQSIKHIADGSEKLLWHHPEIDMDELLAEYADEDKEKNNEYA